MDFIWTSAATYFATHFHITPFWWWVFVGACVTFVSAVVGWAFPVLRGVAGAAILAVIAGLSGYRRAQYDDKKRAAEVAARRPPWRQW
jgi:hypothetical protein